MADRTVTLPAGFACAAYHALVSYGYGNAAPALALKVAEEIRPFLPEPSAEPMQLSPADRIEAIRALRAMADRLERGQ